MGMIDYGTDDSEGSTSLKFLRLIAVIHCWWMELTFLHERGLLTSIIASGRIRCISWLSTACSSVLLGFHMKARTFCSILTWGRPSSVRRSKWRRQSSWNSAYSCWSRMCSSHLNDGKEIPAFDIIRIWFLKTSIWRMGWCFRMVIGNSATPRRTRDWFVWCGSGIFDWWEVRCIPYREAHLLWRWRQRERKVVLCTYGHTTRYVCRWRRFRLV